MDDAAAARTASEPGDPSGAGRPGGPSGAGGAASEPIAAAVLGWDESLRGPLAPAEGFGISRVAVGHRGAFELVGPYGHFVASLEPGLRRKIRSPEGFPTVGDWVTHELVASDDRRVALTQLLPRHSAVIRRAAGTKPAPQVVAANVDVIGVVTTAELLLRGADNEAGHRIERYLVAAAQGKTRAVLVVNKADLVEPDFAQRYQAVHRQRFPAAATPVEVLITSAVTGSGISELTAFAANGSTLALAGASGVGKSSLVNRLLEREALAVGEVSATGGGRHTTIRRELFVVAPTPDVTGPSQAGPGQTGSGQTGSDIAAGTVIDTPGLADLIPWANGDTTGLDQVFADVAQLAQLCHFTDCTHRQEPKCAVLQAVADEKLAPRRLDVYLELAQDIAGE